MVYKLIYNKFTDIAGRILKNIFIFMGPIYIKLGQLLSYEYPILNKLYELFSYYKIWINSVWFSRISFL